VISEIKGSYLNHHGHYCPKWLEEKPFIVEKKSLYSLIKIEYSSLKLVEKHVGTAKNNTQFRHNTL